MTDSPLHGRDAQLAKLVQVPEWQAYTSMLAEQIDTEVLRFAHAAMAQHQGGIGEGDLQYRRGKIAGLKHAVRAAHGAKLRLDKEEPAGA